MRLSNVFEFLKSHSIRNNIHEVFFRLKRARTFRKQEKRGLDSIPLFLISFNRLSYLEKAVGRFERMGIKNIIIIDNASTYPPLLEYYTQIPHKVIRMEKNYGHMVFWNSPELNEYRKSFYLLSDPDVIPVEECPDDVVEKLFYLLKKATAVRKVGLFLKTDDLPEDGVFGDRVIQWEKGLLQNFNDKLDAYDSVIDTTFALYLPDQIVRKDTSFFTALRTKPPYEARHLPWYKRKDEITEEDVFYSQNSITGDWDVAKR